MGNIESFEVVIYADVPVDPEDPESYSHPGAYLWGGTIPIEEFTVQPVGPGPSQGWYDPVTGVVEPNDHDVYFAYNLVDIADPFIQYEDTVYWLFVCAGVLEDPGGEWGWKTADLDAYPPPFTGYHFQDNAAVAGTGIADWVPLYDPVEGHSLDLAFVITCDMGDAIPTVSEWGLVVLALLLLVGGKLYYGSRRSQAVA